MTVEIPATMRAAVLTARGGPEVLVVRDDVPVPIPGPDDALIRVRACGVNNTDINTRVGWYSRSVDSATDGRGFADAEEDDAAWGGGMQFPRIQGADVCGEVVTCTSRPDLIGRRVLVDPWIRDPLDPADRAAAGYLGSERDGGFAQYCCVPARNVHPVRSSASDAELATVACSWSTAEHMLQRVRLGAGQTLAVTGASGGVGSALVQLAKVRGAHVVAVAGAAKAEAVTRLGADSVVRREVGDVPDAAVAANGDPFDAVADVVGGGDVPGWFDALRRGGRYVTSGAIAGPMVALDLRTLYLNDLELYGATVFGPEVFADLVAHVESGAVTLVVGGVFALDDIHAAQEAFGRKDHVGALVVWID